MVQFSGLLAQRREVMDQIENHRYVILKIDGTKVVERADLARLLRAGEPTKVVTVLGSGKEVDLNVNWAPTADAKSKQQ